MNIIDETFNRELVSPDELDTLLSEGWRHFGTLFYRQNLTVFEDKIAQIIPLRVDLNKFQPSKSLRRIKKKNEDTSTEIDLVNMTPVKTKLFHQHSKRFQTNQPDSIETFISNKPDTVPCICKNIDIYLNKKLIATSFLDIGTNSVSSVYGMFDLSHEKRNLGHYTILKEIQYAQSLEKEWYYIGYATIQPSIYDYKKRLPALEAYDWKEQAWKDISEF